MTIRYFPCLSSRRSWENYVYGAIVWVHSSTASITCVSTKKIHIWSSTSPSWMASSFINLATHSRVFWLKDWTLPYFISAMLTLWYFYLFMWMTILQTSNDQESITTLLHLLNQEFPIRNLSNARFFFGIEFFSNVEGCLLYKANALLGFSNGLKWMVLTIF